MISIIPSWSFTLLHFRVSHTTAFAIWGTSRPPPQPDLICLLLTQIDEDAIRALLLSPAFTTTFTRLSKNHGLALPLRFPSPLAELNFLSVLVICLIARFPIVGLGGMLGTLHITSMPSGHPLHDNHV